MNIVQVVVMQESYESDEYGRIECAPVSIKVTVIRLYRAVTQLGLKQCKDACEDRYGEGEKRAITGRKRLTFALDDAGLGRLYKLVHEYQTRAKRESTSQHGHPDVRIVELEDLGDVVCGAVGGA